MIRIDEVGPQNGQKHTGHQVQNRTQSTPRRRWPLRLAIMVLAAAASLALLVTGSRRRLSLSMAMLVLVLMLNHSFYRLLVRRRGPAFAAAALPLHVVHHLVGLAAVPEGIRRYFRRRST